MKAAIEMRNGYKDPERLRLLHQFPCQVCEKFNLVQKTVSEAHHLIGCGLGKKASDLLTIVLCKFHHTSGGNGNAIHETPLKKWEAKFTSQEILLEEVNKFLENIL